MTARREAVTGGRTLSVLAFEAGGHLLAVPADAVERIVAPGEPLPEGTAVIDAAGLLSPEKDSAPRGCSVLLRTGGEGRSVAITACRAEDVRHIDAERLLPLPGFLFKGANPFVGLAAPGQAGGRVVFVLAGPERLLALTSEP